MKYKECFFLQILLCVSLFTSIPISTAEYKPTYQFLDDWRLVIVDEKGVNVTMESRFVFSFNIHNSTDGIIEAEMIYHDHVRLFQWNLYQSHVGDYLIDSSHFSYFYTHWLETHPNISENPNIAVLESSAVDFCFIYYYYHKNVQINFMGDIGKLYTVLGNKSSYDEFIYDEEGVLFSRKQHMILENDTQLLLEEYYKLERIFSDVETTETKFSPLALVFGIFSLVLLRIRKKINNKQTKNNQLFRRILLIYRFSYFSILKIRI